MTTQRIIPALKGWVALPVLAEDLGVKRQRIFQMLHEGKLESAVQIPGTGNRPVAYLVSAEEAARLKAEQDAARAKADAADELAVAGAK
jgi:predicted DNA-binding ArsR family transcriptional regulator